MCKTFRNEYSYTADHTLHISYKLTKTLGIQVLQGKKKKTWLLSPNRSISS